MENGTLQEWVEGFENQLQTRFKNKLLKVYVFDESVFAELDIISIVCRQADISKVDLLNPSKGPVHVSDARMVICYLLSVLKKMKPALIAEKIQRDRTTVLHALNVIKDRLECKDEAIVKLIQKSQTKIIEQAKIIEDEKHV